METRTAARTEIADDPQALSQAVAEWLTERIAASDGIFRIALSGGTTPRPLYALLATKAFRPRIDWSKLEFFWGDERFVPHDDPDSNYRMARELLLGRVPVRPERIHPMPVDGALEDCAQRYEGLLKRIYRREDFDSAKPLFDMVLLGIGTDGHTASLLPGAPALEERTRWVAAVAHGAAQPRLTLTYPAIASSRTVAFIATGAEKRGIVARVQSGDTTLPAARVTSNGEVIRFLDRAAAGR
jgi:6-phosphogluconolactonase